MKTMTCKQLAGACDEKFYAKTFEKMANLSQKHGQEMFGKGDQPHLKAQEEMKKMMADPQAMGQWMSEKKKEFDSLSEDTNFSSD